MKKLTLFILIFASINAFGQIENAKIRKGNKYFEQKNYSKAESEYQRALKINPKSNIALFNYADAQYKQKNYKNALNNFQQTSERIKSKDSLHSVYYNIGNTLVKLAEDSIQKRNLNGAVKNLQSALNSYKESIKMNPNDKEAKFNYVVTKKLLDKLKQQQKKQNKNNKNKQKQQNKKQQKKNDKNKQNKKKDQQNKNNQNQKKKQNKNDKGQQKYPISYKDMMRLLKAVEQGDVKTYQKVKAKMQKNVKSKTKNW